jgi:hypothetical protein
MTDYQLALEREAGYLHACFFRRPIPEAVTRRYVAADAVCFPGVDARNREMVETIVAHRLDAEAIELALRLRRGSGVLTRKIQILFYLVEVRSAYYDDFVNQTPGLCRALLRLAGSSARTAWKLGKGWYLVRRYGFV